MTEQSSMRIGSITDLSNEEARQKCEETPIRDRGSSTAETGDLAAIAISSSMQVDSGYQSMDPSSSSAGDTSSSTESRETIVVQACTCCGTSMRPAFDEDSDDEILHSGPATKCSTYNCDNNIDHLQPCHLDPYTPIGNICLTCFNHFKTNEGDQIQNPLYAEHTIQGPENAPCTICDSEHAHMWNEEEAEKICSDCWITLYRDGGVPVPKYYYKCKDCGAMMWRQFLKGDWICVRCWFDWYERQKRDDDGENITGEANNWLMDVFEDD